MITFKSLSDLSKLDPNDPAFSIIEVLVQRLCTDIPKENFKYDPIVHGFIALIEKHDVNRVLDQIWPNDGYSLITIPYEGVLLEDGFYKMIFLANNDFGIIFLADSDIINGDLKNVLDNYLDP